MIRRSTFLALALVMAALSGAPAHADDGLSGLLSVFSSGLTSLGNLITGGTDKNVTATVQAQKLATLAQQKNTEWQVIENNRNASAGAVANAANLYSPPTKYACAVVTDGRSEPGRIVAESVAARSIQDILTSLFTGPDSGSAISDSKLAALFCQLGVIGKDRLGCTVDANPLVKGCDTDIGKCFLEKFCIPFDVTEVSTELTKAITAVNSNGTYTPTDTTREAIAALLSIRKSLGRQCSWPKGDQMKTLSGVSAGAEMGDTLNIRTAPNQAILEGLKYHLCFKMATMLPNCDKNDQGLLGYLKTAFPSAATAGNPPNLPPSGYCLSHWQVDLGKNVRDRIAQQNEAPTMSGTDADKSTWLANVEAGIAKRISDHKQAMDLASTSAGNRSTATSCPASARAVSDNDIRDLKDSIRKLTRAIEQQGTTLPRTLDVKAKLPPKAKPEAHVEDMRGTSSAAALPPLRQDFPVVP